MNTRSIWLQSLFAALWIGAAAAAGAQTAVPPPSGDGATAAREAEARTCDKAHVIRGQGDLF